MTTVLDPPQIPSKTEIIPIHTSDRGAFMKCRRRWDWSSPMRNNLVPDVRSRGVYFPFWFGSGIHYGMRNYYDPRIAQDPVEAFAYWFDMQWNGGIVEEDFLDFTYDRNPKPFEGAHGDFPDGFSGTTPLYYIKGLKELHPDPDFDEFETHRILGLNMLKYYRHYAEEFDDFDVLMAEHTFSVPIIDPSNGKVLMWRDWRDGEMKEVHARGTSDAIIRHKQTGVHGILEHKSAVDITDTYFEKLSKDEQCTSYVSAARLEAKVYGLPYTDVRDVLYNAVRKAFPRPPTINKNGMPSINRSQESTTYEMFVQAVQESGRAIIVQNDPKYISYMQYLQDVGHEQFIVRKTVPRNHHEIASHRENLFNQAVDMLNDPSIYPNPTGEFSCTRCPFRVPCIAKDDGSDWEMMLSDGFVKNWGR